MGMMKRPATQKMMGRGPGARGGGWSVTSWFFDAPAVEKAVDAATRKVLSRFGAYVRRTMKSSIRKRKRYSKPGEPPSSHAGHLKQFIFFYYDPRTRGVVIGPEKLNAKIGDTPHVLEYGGKNVVATARRSGGKRVTTKRTVHIKARPFARPALAKELPKLPGMWTGSVKT